MRQKRDIKKMNLQYQKCVVCKTDSPLVEVDLDDKNNAEYPEFWFDKFSTLQENINGKVWHYTDQGLACENCYPIESSRDLRFKTVLEKITTPEEKINE